MDKPLVSICIPTYNRSQYLKKTIESIIVQQEFIDKKVEIVINDNCSTDDTKDMVGAYVSKYENITYFCNKENVRDKNYPICMSRANGVLRKLNNDTVLFRPNALKELCALVEKYQQTKPFIFIDNGMVKSDGSIEELNFHDFIMQQSFNITWIGAFTLWDKDCKELLNDTYGCELCLWQLCQLVTIGSLCNRIIILHDKILDVQKLPKKNVSYGFYKVFYENYFQILEPCFNDGTFTSDDREYLEKDLLYNFFTDWIVTWELHNEKFEYAKDEDLKSLVFETYQHKPYWHNYLRYYQRKKIMKRIVFALNRLRGRK